MPDSIPTVTDADPARLQRAMSVTLENLGSLTRAAERIEDYDLAYQGQGLVQITRKDDASRSYHVTRHTCGCKDQQYRGHVRPCFHVQIARAFLSLQPEEAPEARRAQALADRAQLWGD